MGNVYALTFQMSEVMVWQQATGNTTPFISALPGLREERLRNVRRCGSSSLFLFMYGERVITPGFGFLAPNFFK